MTNKPQITQEQFDKKVEHLSTDPMADFLLKSISKERLVKHIKITLKDTYDIK